MFFRITIDYASISTPSHTISTTNNKVTSITKS